MITRSGAGATTRPRIDNEDPGIDKEDPRTTVTFLLLSVVQEDMQKDDQEQRPDIK